MPKVEVYELGSCCADNQRVVTPGSPRSLFAADLKWLEAQGVQVIRYRFAENADAFQRHPAVKALIEAQGHEALPILLVDGDIASCGGFPSRPELAKAVGLNVRGDGELFQSALRVAAGLSAAVVAGNVPAVKSQFEQASQVGLMRDDLAIIIQVVRQFPVRSDTLEAVERLLAFGTTDPPKSSSCCKRI